MNTRQLQFHVPTILAIAACLTAFPAAQAEEAPVLQELRAAGNQFQVKDQAERSQEVFATFLRPLPVKRIILLEDRGLGRHAGLDPDELFARLIKSSVPGADFGIDAWEAPVARFLLLMKTDEVFEVTVLSQVVRRQPAVTGVLLFGKGCARRFDFRTAPLTAAKKPAAADDSQHQDNQLLHRIPKLDGEWQLLVDEEQARDNKGSRFQ